MARLLVMAGIVAAASARGARFGPPDPQSVARPRPGGTVAGGC
jgi:hypothetical protein